jgi:tetratricopeptide (TPR) repeat protein
MRRGVTIFAFVLSLVSAPAMAQSSDCRNSDPDKAIAGCSADILRATPVPTAQGMLPVYYYLRASAYEKKDMLDEAKADLDKAVALMPGFKTYFNRALFCSDHGLAKCAFADFETAIAAYEKSPEKPLEDFYAQANFRHAENLRRSDRLVEAMTSYDKAVSTRPDNMEFLYTRALANSRLQRLDAVIADLTVVIENPRRQGFFVSGLINRSLAYMRKNDFPAAIADLDRALAAEPSSPLALVRRGYVFEQAGQRDKAIADYRKALSVYAKMDEALEGLKRLGAQR